MSRIIKKEDGYWIVDLPYVTPDCGPYRKLKGTDSDECAEQGMRDLERFFLEYWELLSRKKILVKTRKCT